MRPDPHKAKESRKYQQRMKQAGDSSAAEIAENRKKELRTRDRGVGINAIRRRNGEVEEETEEQIEQRKAQQAKFSRRKLESNNSRYEEETEQEALERDAELGIDRETTDLVSMLVETEEGSSTLFKFKDEQLLSNSTTEKENIMNQNFLQLDFAMFEPTLEPYDTRLLLGLHDADQILVNNALNDHPIVLDKPIVPSFSKNGKGYILFKQHQSIKPNVISESNGIYLRNDGSNHRVTPGNKAPLIQHNNNNDQTAKTSLPSTVATDELDELLSLDKKTGNSTSAASPVKPAMTPMKNTTLPRPGSIKNPIVKQKEQEVDDEAWLDDLLDQ